MGHTNCLCLCNPHIFTHFNLSWQEPVIPLNPIPIWMNSYEVLTTNNLTVVTSHFLNSLFSSQSLNFLHFIATLAHVSMRAYFQPHISCSLLMRITSRGVFTQLLWLPCVTKYCYKFVTDVVILVVKKLLQKLQKFVDPYISCCCIGVQKIWWTQLLQHYHLTSPFSCPLIC